VIASRDYWLPVPGYERYQVNPYGDVRKADDLKHLKQSDNGDRIVVKFTVADDGKRQTCKVVARLVADAFLPKAPGKKYVWHKNGLHYDNFVGNLEWVTKDELFERFKPRRVTRKPVVKIAPDGEPNEFYPSARAAARANYMDLRTVLDRCYGKIRDPFALNGFTFTFDEDINACQRGRRKNNGQRTFCSSH